MENVIEALGTDFVVSKQAVKIRLVELGFDQAIGTYTYLDDHYVKPHGFKKGSIKTNQTFSISSQDATIERLTNPALRKLTDSGDYLFIDNHYVYNAPLYVQLNEDGRLDLTDYARSHMDECCLVFDMTIKSRVGTDYHTACFLNREPNDIEFELKYNNQYAHMVPSAQADYRKKVQAEELEIRKQMTDDQAQCMKLLLDWKKMKYTELGDEIGRDPKTIGRIAKGETQPGLITAALICFGLKLSPIISDKLMEVFGCKVYNSMKPDEQWINEALHVKYAPLKGTEGLTLRDTLISDEASPEAIAMDKALLAALYEELDRLDPDGRRICELVAANCTEREGAAILGISKTTYRYRWAKLREKLAEKLKDYT